MKREDICIFTDKYLCFEMLVPETPEEYVTGLSFRKEQLPEKFGMLYYRRSNYDDFKFWTKDTPWEVDYIFIDSFGNIMKISTAKPFSEEIHKCNNSYTALEIKGGECERLGIKEGDTVYYSKTHFLPNNELMYNHFLFKKLTFRNKSKVKYENLYFVTLAELGAMGWAGSMEFFGIQDGNILAYLANSTAFDYFELVESVFPPLKGFDCGIANIGVKLKDPNWKRLYMGFGNHLFIRNDVYDEFVKKISVKGKLPSPSDIYVNWLEVARKILESKIKASGVKKKDRIDTYGYTLDNPVKLSMVSDEYYLLDRLHPNEGYILEKKRIGSMHSDKNDHILDCWEVKIETMKRVRTIKLYLDPYAYKRPWNMPPLEYSPIPEGFFFCERGDK